MTLAPVIHERWDRAAKQAEASARVVALGQPAWNRSQKPPATADRSGGVRWCPFPAGDRPADRARPRDILLAQAADMCRERLRAARAVRADQYRQAVAGSVRDLSERSAQDGDLVDRGVRARVAAAARRELRRVEEEDRIGVGGNV